MVSVSLTNSRFVANTAIISKPVNMMFEMLQLDDSFSD